MRESWKEYFMHHLLVFRMYVVFQGPMRPCLGFRMLRIPVTSFGKFLMAFFKRQLHCTKESPYLGLKDLKVSPALALSKVGGECCQMLLSLAQKSF